MIKDGRMQRIMIGTDAAGRFVKQQIDIFMMLDDFIPQGDDTALFIKFMIAAFD